MGVIVELPAIHVTGENPGSLVGGRWSNAGPHLHLRLWESWERPRGMKLYGSSTQTGRYDQDRPAVVRNLQNPYNRYSQG